jgi:hypothetical protein
MTRVPTALGCAAKVDRLVMVGLRRVAVRKGKVRICGFLLASDKSRYDVSVKPIMGFDGQRQPWAKRDILFEPKLDGLPT